MALETTAVRFALPWPKPHGGLFISELYIIQAQATESNVSRVERFTIPPFLTVRIAAGYLLIAQC